MFTDECKFDLGSLNKRWIRLDSESQKKLKDGDLNVYDLINRPTKKFEPGIMIAGGISYYGLSNIIFIEGTMNNFAYGQTLIFYNEDIEEIKRKKELHAYILYVINQFIWGIQGLQLKSFSSFFLKDFDINSFVFYRHLGLSIAGYLSIYYKKINMKYPWQINHRIWFYIRNIGIYICIHTWMDSLEIFRLSTCQILGGLGPFLTIIFSVIFLKEKFHSQYAYGIIIYTGNDTKIMKNINRTSMKF